MNNTRAMIIIIVAACVLALGVRGAMLSASPIVSNVIGADWSLYFQPAALQVAANKSPYDVDGFWNPPWLLPPMVPLAKLPLTVAVPIMFTINTLAFVWVSLRLGMNKFMVIPFFIFWGGVMNSVMGNIDGLIALGLLCPPWLGVIIVMIKPQVGFPIIVFWALREYTKGGSLGQRVRRVAFMFLPFAVSLLLSILVYGMWPLNAAGAIVKPWNTAPWPLGIPVGVWLLFAGIHKNDVNFALMAIPFVTPYLTIYTWSFSAMGACIAVSQLLLQYKWSRSVCDPSSLVLVE